MPEELKEPRELMGLRSVRDQVKVMQMVSDKEKIKRLAKKGTPEAFKEIMKKWLVHNNNEIRKAAQEALTNKKAVQTLVDHGVKSKDGGLAMISLEILGKTRDESAIDQIIKHGMKRSNNVPHVPITATETIGMIGGDKAMDTLVNLLEHENPYVQVKAANWLGTIATERVLDSILEKGLKAKASSPMAEAVMNSIVRMSNNGRLSKKNKDKVMDRITLKLKDPDEDVKQAAAFALSNLGGKKALLRLMKHAGSGNERTKKSIKDAIKRVQEREKNA